MCICLVHFSRHPHRTGAAHSVLLEYIYCWACLGLALFALKIAPRLSGISTPIWYMVPWAHRSQRLGRHLDRFSRFCTAFGIVPIFYGVLPFFPVIIAPSHSVSGPYMVPGPCESITANGISICSAVFAGLTILWHRDELTHHATPSVIVGFIYVVLQCGLIIHRVKWRHVSVVAVRSPFYGAMLSYCV